MTFIGKKAGGALAVGILALSVGVSPSTAMAQLKTADANSGRATAIFNAGVYDTRNCSQGPLPSMTGYRADHGTIRTQVHTGRLEKGVCKGKTIRTLLFIYTSDRGFRGTDNVVLNYKFPAHAGVQFAAPKRARVRVKVR